ncbi:hypothetical protein TNCV_483371 [Trichonephila clavipes]|uniref:Uncharacterized protein n=1 Tax=Trichonephila clavipes TaxID=2585209 RepID=A0A8X6RHF8_TRICX|nr:hypothetical protein TNCV_483371 [Trichonephila clavipes]
MVWAAIGYTTRTPLTRVVGNPNNQRNISQILRPMAVLCLAGLRVVISQQNNARPHAPRHVQTYLSTDGVRLLP